ncbi:MAG TPA: capsule biosynthesis GfcC family protein, partial [Deltaproteobacteria bacterium]|nr:capsule biosynthesis GfcC family protein [Deltaproteobacteria bacterium]
ELQQKGIEEMVTRLRRELLAESAGEVSTSSSAEEVQAKKAELESKQKFIEALRDLKATGRMTIGLAHLRLLKGSEYDIELEEGDHLHIPTMSSSVNVMGSVMSLGSYVYSEKFSYKDYVAMSGGYTRYADTDNVYVLKVDGSARKLSRGFFNWNDPKSRWEVTTFGQDIREIEPGDSIIVPEKLDRIAWLREVKDITQILMQMAVTAGVVIKLF